MYFTTRFEKENQVVFTGGIMQKKKEEKKIVFNLITPGLQY